MKKSTKPVRTSPEGCYQYFVNLQRHNPELNKRTLLKRGAENLGLPVDHFTALVKKGTPKPESSDKLSAKKQNEMEPPISEDDKKLFLDAYDIYQFIKHGLPEKDALRAGAFVMGISVKKFKRRYDIGKRIVKTDIDKYFSPLKAYETHLKLLFVPGKKPKNQQTLEAGSNIMKLEKGDYWKAVEKGKAEFRAWLREVDQDIRKLKLEDEKTTTCIRISRLKKQIRDAKGTATKMSISKINLSANSGEDIANGNLP